MNSPALKGRFFGFFLILVWGKKETSENFPLSKTLTKLRDTNDVLFLYFLGKSAFSENYNIMTFCAENQTKKTNHKNYCKKDSTCEMSANSLKS